MKLCPSCSQELLARCKNCAHGFATHYEAFNEGRKGSMLLDVKCEEWRE